MNNALLINVIVTVIAIGMIAAALWKIFYSENILTQNKFFRWLFATPEGDRAVGSIILWWEARRIPYNLIVGILGACSLLLFFLFISLSGMLKPGEDAVEPIALIAFPIFANVCYTGGSVAEVVVRLFRLRKFMNVGPRLLRFGIAFSLFIVFFPSVYWGVFLALKTIGLKGNSF